MRRQMASTQGGHRRLHCLGLEGFGVYRDEGFRHLRVQGLRV